MKWTNIIIAIALGLVWNISEPIVVIFLSFVFLSFVDEVMVIIKK